MRILAIDTATPCVGGALWQDEGLLASFVLVAGRRHAEVLLPAVDDLCRRAGLSVADIDAVAVDVGPGLFTGLRVGLATARTIALARDLPAVGVTSLEALAHPQRHRPGALASIVDARRGEVYWSVFESDGRRISEVVAPAVARPEEVSAALAALAGPDRSPLAVGDGAWRYRDLFAAAGAEVAGPAEMWPSPVAVAELGAARLAAGPVPPALPAPLYLRQADVRIGWDQFDGRAGTPGARAAGPPVTGAPVTGAPVTGAPGAGPPVSVPPVTVAPGTAFPGAGPRLGQ